MVDKPKILVNGQEVDLSNVPEQFQGMLKDENQNGIPDMMEGMLSQLKNLNPAAAQTIQQYFVNGQAYQNLENLPPEVKARVQQKLAAISNLGVFGGSPPANSGTPTQWPSPGGSPQALNPQNFQNLGTNYANPAFPKNNSMLYIALIAMTGICVFVGLLLFFFWRKGFF